MLRVASRWGGLHMGKKQKKRTADERHEHGGEVNPERHGDDCICCCSCLCSCCYCLFVNKCVFMWVG